MVGKMRLYYNVWEKGGRRNSRLRWSTKNGRVVALVGEKMAGRRVILICIFYMVPLKLQAVRKKNLKKFEKGVEN